MFKDHIRGLNVYLKDHIRGFNVYLRNNYYMKLEELLNTEHHDGILVTLKELAEKQREFNREYFSTIGTSIGITTGIYT